MKNVKKALAILLVICILFSQPFMFYHVQAADSYVTLDSVTQIGANKLQLRFSEAVGNNGTAYCAVRLVDNTTAQNLQWSGGTPLQWGGYLAYMDGSNLSWTMTDTTLGVSTLEGILALVAPGGAYEGCAVMYCMEESGSVAGDGYMGSFWASADASKLVKATKPVQAGMPDGTYVAITGLLKDLMEIESVTYYNDHQILIEFSEPFNNFGGYYTAIRFVDNATSQTLQWDGGNPLQYHLTISEYYGSNGNMLLGTLDGDLTIDQVLAMCDAGGAYENYTAMFCIEEGGAVTGENGRLDNFTGNVTGTKLKATRSVGLDGVYVEMQKTDTLTVESAKAINDRQVVLHFSEPTAFGLDGTASPFIAIRMVDASNNLVWDGAPDASTPMQFYGSWEWRNDEHTEIVWTISPSNTYGVSDLTTLFSFGGGLEAFSANSLKFCIEEIPYTSATAQISGKIDNITTADGSGMLSANKAGGRDGLYLDVDMDYTVAPLTIVGTTAINESQIVIEFSEPVNYNNSGANNGPFPGIRLVDSNNNLVWDGTPDASTPMQWGGTLDYFNESHTKLIWTMNGSNTYDVSNLDDLLNYVGIEAYSSYALKFCFEEIDYGGLLDGVNGLVENIKTLDSTRSLDTDTVIADRLDASYTDITVNYNNSRKLTLDSATAVNDKQILLSFSAPIEVEGEPFFSLRYVDENGHLKWTGEENKSVALQFGGTWKYYNDSHTQIIWTMYGSNTYGACDLTDVFGYAGGLSAYSGCAIRICIEEKGSGSTPSNSLVENISRVSDGKSLDGQYRYGGYYDGAYIPVSMDFNINPVTLVSTTAVNDTQIVLEFTDAVTIDDPYMGIRLVDSSGKLVWDGEVNKSTPMQWGGYGTWKYYNDSHTKIIWTISGNTYGEANLTDIFSYAGKLADYSGYAIKFCIEEVPEDDMDLGDLLISDITAKNGTVHLSGNSLGGRDGLYADINVAYDLRQLRMTDITAINDTQIVVSFSEPVNCTFAGDEGPFMAIRYVDAKGNLAWDGIPEKSTPLQFTGIWEYYNSSHTQLVWTMSGNNTYGACNLTDVLTYANELAGFSDYSIRFCIEEKSYDNFTVNPANELVENVKSADGTVSLRATLVKDGYFDGAYRAISIDYDQTPLTIKSAAAINDTQVVLEFSGPIAINLQEENRGPFMAIRYVDESGNLVWSGEPEESTSLQFEGSYTYYNDEHTQILWTMNEASTLHANTLTDVLTYAGELSAYSDSDIMFCIEEVPYADIDMGNALICNITNENGTVHLAATKLGGWDGTYVTLTADYDLEATQNEPDNNAGVQGEEFEPTTKESYTWLYILSGGIVLIGGVAGGILGLRKVKKHS